jgi:FkbM family methyltransferase
MTGNAEISPASGKTSLAARIRRFVRRPREDKHQVLRLRLKRLWSTLFPGIPLPVVLPYGGWWLARNDLCGDLVFGGRYEEAERRFVQSWLRPGMVVLDIGAHNGFYTLLASRQVGPTGAVVAFEPSPRERKRLLTHLRLNRCKNVRVESFALGDVNGEAQLFVVKGRGTGLNSLRLPPVEESTETVDVHITTLDDYVHSTQLAAVDFIKMDVEGGELAVLKGATALLGRCPRPVFLCEVEDARTRPWGYEAKEIVAFLSRLGYEWFNPLATGRLSALPPEQLNSQTNLVAVPGERRDQLTGSLRLPAVRAGAARRSDPERVHQKTKETDV